MTPSLEGWPTKAKEAHSPHEVRLAPLDTNPVFQSLEENTFATASPKEKVLVGFYCIAGFSILHVPFLYY